MSAEPRSLFLKSHGESHMCHERRPEGAASDVWGADDRWVPMLSAYLMSAGCAWHGHCTDDPRPLPLLAQSRCSAQIWG